MRKSEKFIDESKNDTKNYAHRLWGCPSAQLFPFDDNFPKNFPLFTSTLSPHARESGNLGFRIRLMIGIRNPVPEIRNPRRGIQNPSLYWIPLLGASNRKMIEKSFSSEISLLIRTSCLVIESRQPTNAICIYNIQEKVSLT